jgi:small subunit ribosomal protein S18
MFDDRERDRDRDRDRNKPTFKKSCVFCKKELDIDYKNIDLLSRYVSSKGKLLSRRVSGNCAKHQRKVAVEIRRARYLGLLAYV